MQGNVAMGEEVPLDEKPGFRHANASGAAAAVLLVVLVFLIPQGRAQKAASDQK